MRQEIVDDLHNRIIEILKNPSVGRQMGPKYIVDTKTGRLISNDKGVIVPPACLTEDDKIISVSYEQKVKEFLKELGLNEPEIKAALTGNVQRLRKSA